MKKTTKIPVIFYLCTVSFLLLFWGCASVEMAPESWVGKNKSDLIASWGLPKVNSQDGKGGEILIYEEYFNVADVPGRVEPVGGTNVVFSKPKQIGYVQKTIFYVDDKGYIYHWEKRNEDR